MYNTQVVISGIGGANYKNNERLALSILQDKRFPVMKYLSNWLKKTLSTL